MIKLSFDIESREYNGRWFTSIRGWKADKLDGSSNVTTVAEPPIPNDIMPPTLGNEDNDDLPF